MPQNPIQWVSVVVMTASLYLGLIRNTQVARFKQDLNMKVSEYQQRNIKKNHDLDWEAYGLYDQVGYHKLVWMFWKPLNSFVPEKLKKILNVK